LPSCFSGLTLPLLWPITDHRFAMPGLYLSSDRWPAVVATAVAAVVWVVDRLAISKGNNTQS
jgi:hypothetical protein